MSQTNMTTNALPTMEAENRDFLSFLESGDANAFLHSAVDAAEEFASADDIISGVAEEEVALDFYAECADRLFGAALDAQAVVELYIDGRGSRDDMLAASKRVAEGDVDGWKPLLIAAHYCQHSDRDMPLELRRNLRKIGVKGRVYRQTHYRLQTAYQTHLRVERDATRGPLISHGSIGEDFFEVRGDAHPVLYVYRKIDGNYVEKSSLLGDMERMDLAKQLLSELPGVMS